MYEYKAKCLRVIDGDSLAVYISLGFDCYIEKHLRLLGIDCPETRGKEKEKGKKAKQFVEEWFEGMEDEWPLIIRTKKADSFGRYLALVFYQDECLNEILLEKGLAVPFMVEST